MRRFRSMILVLGLSFGLASADGGQGQPPPSDPLTSLKKEVDDSYAAFSRAYGREPEN